MVVACGDDTASCERPDLPGVFVTEDVYNVQTAVNAHPGGKILLKGVFHFAEYGVDGFVVPGTDGTIFITNDVGIYGERRGDHYKTKIKGGYAAFSIGYKPTAWRFAFAADLHATSASNAIPIAVTVKDIAFENALFAPIFIWATVGATIEGNQITDARALSIEDVFETGAHATAVGIVALPPASFSEQNPNLITGRVKISNNQICGMYRRAEADDPWQAPSYRIPVRGIAQGGIWLAQYQADVTIANNAVSGAGIVGILAGGNDGATQIIDNKIRLEVDDSEICPSLFGVQVSGAYFYDGSEKGDYLIAGNDIFVGVCPSAHGVMIDSVQKTAVVRDNFIEFHSKGGTAITIDASANSEIVDNRIQGEGLHAIQLMHNPDWLPTRANVIRANKIDNFKADKQAYFLGNGVSDSRLFVGRSNALLDESGNETNCICFEPE